MQREPDAHAPFAWTVSQVCEEFGCLPSEAVDELDHDPDGLTFDVLFLRSFKRTWDAWSAAAGTPGGLTDLPETPMLQFLRELLVELAHTKAT